MSIRRVMTVAIAVALSLVAGAAQEMADSEPIPNWTAPPFWVPGELHDLEKLKEAGVLSPMATEVVPTGPLPFFGITPCRLVDTRPSQGFTGTYGPPILLANATRNFDLNSAPHCSTVPANAEAYSLNITVTETAGPGDVRVWPTGTAPLNVSTQNWPTANSTLANAAIVPAGTSGSVTVQIAGSNTHLIIDINGYYAPIGIVNTVNGLSGAVTLAAGSNVSITPAGNTLTIAATGGGGSSWSLTGNGGTTPGTHFLGTTDNQALEIKVFNQRAMRFEPHIATGVPNVIGGSSANSVTAGVYSATIGGGGFAANLVTDSGGTVAGGSGNQAGDNAGITTDRLTATVGGGSGNIASGAYSVVAGGTGNSAGDYSAVTGGTSNDAQCCRNFIGGGDNNTTGPGGFWLTVAGGLNNAAQGDGATVGGGQSNTANNGWATVPGGRSNAATGTYSFAAGRRAAAGHQGAFVWGDSTDADVGSTAVNQFIVRAAGGIWLGTTSTPSITIATDFLNTSTGGHLTIGGAWTDNSDRNSKENFQEIDQRDILSRVATLPITRWSYKAEGCDVEHLGPMAQDFSAAFGLGSDDRSISTLDSSGVALAAIQALYDEVQELRKRLTALEAEKD